MDTWWYEKVSKNKTQSQKIWDQIFQTCAKLIYSQLATYDWNQNHLGYQEGGV